jgi:hypothetical protein
LEPRLCCHRRFHTVGRLHLRPERRGFRLEFSVTLDETFPLDDGENAAVTFANDRRAALLLCEEFTRVGIVYTSLADTRPVTTPALLAVLVRNGRLGPDGAAEALDRIAAARSWDGDSYVERARRLLDGG